MSETHTKKPIERTEGAIEELTSAIQQYLKWMTSSGHAHGTQLAHKRGLGQFLEFIARGGYPWESIFTRDTFEAFNTPSDMTRSAAVIGLSRYLHEQGKIARHLHRKKRGKDLPPVFEQYLSYHQKRSQVPERQMKTIRYRLEVFYDYLEAHKIRLGRLKIEQVDAFMARLYEKYAANTCDAYRSYLRSFLRYLHHERRVLPRDLAPLVVGRREYSKAKPPKFLRPEEVRNLFASLSTASASDIRTCATIYLAYTLGLRPLEICRLCLDDISFRKQVLTLKHRKNNHPTELPICEAALKAVAAYIIGVRPQSHHRTVFLTLHPPYRPLKPHSMTKQIKIAMKKAGIEASAYWLRHTYAQNLLESGASIYEIKDMLGHDKIESTKLYLHVHTKLMRRVLFDETL
jgi:integrase/recombinase XerD